MNTMLHLLNTAPNHYAMMVRRISNVLILLALGFSLQAQCPTSLICSSNIQLSLNENCTETVVANMLIKNPTLPNSEYVVVVKKKNGPVVPGNVMGPQHIGMVFEVSVSLPMCGFSCWGIMTVEDKFPPVITGCDEVTVSCDDSIEPNAMGVPPPVGVDACGSVTAKQGTDRLTKYPCTFPGPYSRRIERPWTFTDQYGNKSICTQVINVLRGDIDSVMGPRDFDDMDTAAFLCEQVLDTLSNGAPTIKHTGTPTMLGCDNFQSTFTDIVFPVCGRSRKYLRQWQVIDWCTGRDTVLNQIIKILDKNPPFSTLDPNTLIKIPTDKKKCTATYTVPPPQATDCNTFTYAVGYRLRLPNGTYAYTEFVHNIYFSPSGKYTIYNLPQDTTIIVYKLTDACGNMSEYTYKLLVEDREAPIAICEGFTVVSLKENGWADLLAESVNSGSEDNCGIVDFKIRRLKTFCPSYASDTTFKDKINFCCEDVSTDPNFYIKVVLRVYDAAGNYNDCITNVKVQDKRPPVIECPDDVTLECYEDYTDLSNTNGSATATDNCGVTITYRDVPHLNKCHIGHISRVWVATDGQGLKDSCIQWIWIVNSDPFDEDYIHFPPDTIIDGCYDPEYLTPEYLHMKPWFLNTHCADLAVSYDDEYYYVDHACKKILRKWRVINWCDYDPNNKIVFYKTQVIIIKNTTAPWATLGCVDRTIVSKEGDCEELVHHRIEAMDDCTPQNKLKYEWEVDLFSDQTIDDKGFGQAVSDVYPVGIHKMTFRIFDDCGNEGICMYTFKVTDNKKPTPICHGELIWVMNEDGEAEIWANDFDLKSESFCGDTELRFAFDEAGLQDSLLFTCDDVPNGVAARIPLRMYVFDSDGNFDFCTVSLILQDSPITNSCPDDLTNGASIGGKVMGLTPNQPGVQNVEIKLTNITSGAQAKIMTDAQGDYTFKGGQYYSRYEVQPSKVDDIQNGITSIDMVLLQRHLLGLTKLDSPYKLIAADTDGNQKILSSDLVLLRKVLLGKTDSFGTNKAWRFIPHYFEFKNPEKPWDFPEYIHYDTLMVDEIGSDFVIVKTGDLNGSAEYNATNNATGQRSTTLLQGEELHVNAAEEITINLKTTENISFSGMQTGLIFESGMMNVRSIKVGETTLDSDHYNEENGVIKFVYIPGQSETVLKDNTLISITGKALSSGTLHFELDSRFGSFIINETLEPTYLGLELNTRTNQNISVNVTPNPFTEMTQLNIFSQSEGNAIIRLFEVTGREIHKEEKFLRIGHNTHSITELMLNNSPGLYFYKVEINNKILTGKLMLVR